jgi:hypothetical protein
VVPVDSPIVRLDLENVSLKAAIEFGLARTLPALQALGERENSERRIEVDKAILSIRAC